MKGSETVASIKPICTCCGKERNLGDYYASSSPFHKHTRKLHVCKKCIWDSVNGITKSEIEKASNVLRMIDRPFIESLWNSSVEESENASKELFGIYMKNLGMVQYRELTWADSEFFAESNTVSTSEEINETVLTKDIGELKKKWGSYNEVDYEYLENFYGEYKNSYATDTPVQINLYRNIAKVHLQAEKELSNGNTKAFKDLMELSSKLHNDGNIKPIQSTGANDDKGLSTYGLWIKTVEQDEPCEYFEDKSLYEDYDKLKKYWEKWFVRPFKNIFNISKDFDVRDDD